PDKSAPRIEGAIQGMKAAIIDTADAKKRYKSAPRFAPAGQSTQMIVGADAATDGDIIARAHGLYDRFGLRRVYYS
ncbi:radical SAM protein, partial [Acinetobacter baumannii]